MLLGYFRQTLRQNQSVFDAINDRLILTIVFPIVQHIGNIKALCKSQPLINSHVLDSSGGKDLDTIAALRLSKKQCIIHHCRSIRPKRNWRSPILPGIGAYHSGLFRLDHALPNPPKFVKIWQHVATKIIIICTYMYQTYWFVCFSFTHWQSFIVMKNTTTKQQFRNAIFSEWKQWRQWRQHPQ